MLAVATLAAVAIVGLLAYVAWLSLRTDVTGGTATLDNYLALVTDPLVYRTLANTMVFALTTLVVAMALGVACAWIVERTDFRGRIAVYVAMVVGALIPGFIDAMGWLFLFHPKIGLFNRWLLSVLGPHAPAFDVTTLIGMGVAQGTGLAAIVFVMTVPGLRAMDPALEEAAQMSGAGLLASLRRVTLPLNVPGLLGTALFVFIIAMSSFDVPAVIGLSTGTFTFSTYLFTKIQPISGLVPRYGVAAAFGVFVMGFSLIAGVLYIRVLSHARRYATVGGRAYRSRPIRLGAWAAAAWAFVLLYLLFARILPVLVLAWAALLPFLRMPSPEAVAALSTRNFENAPWDSVGAGAQHTALLVVGAPALTLAISVAISWTILRSRLRHRLLYDYVAFLTLAVPPIVFAFGALVASLFLFARFGPLSDLYGSLWVLLIAYGLINVAFGTRVTNSALIAIHGELEEAAHVSGASGLGALRRVLIPLMRPALLLGWVWMGMQVYRELTVAQVLVTPRNETLSAVVFGMFRAGRLGQASAVAIGMIALVAPLVAVYLKLGGLSSVEAPLRAQ